MACRAGWIHDYLREGASGGGSGSGGSGSGGPWILPWHASGRNRVAHAATTLQGNR